MLAIAVLAAALALRLPHVHTVPRFTDETDEVKVALAILDDARPLTSDDAYRGPLWSYLLAGVMFVTGVQPETPRLFAAVLSAAGAVAAFGLAHDLAARRKRWAGAIAGAGVATATGLATLGAHIAWSNNSSPLWFLLGAWTLHRASTTGHRRWWVACGLAWAAAVQSHPSLVAPLVGAGAWSAASMVRRGGSLKRGGMRGHPSAGGPPDTVGHPRAGGLGVLLCGIAFLALMSPMVLHNIREPFASLHSVADADLATSGDSVAATFGASAMGMAAQLGRVAGAGPLAPDLNVATNALQTSTTWLYAAALLGALLFSLVRGPRLVGAMAASSVVILPLLNQSWENPYDGRYVGFLVALGWVAVGVFTSGAMPLLTKHSSRVSAAIMGVAGILAAYPVFVSFAWYETEVAAGRTNVPYLQEAVRLAELSRASGAPILLDDALEQIELGGSGNGRRALAHVLRLEGVPVFEGEESDIRWYLAQPDSSVVIVASSDAAGRLDGTWTKGVSPAWAVQPIGAAREAWASAESAPPHNGAESRRTTGTSAAAP